MCPSRLANAYPAFLLAIAFGCAARPVPAGNLEPGRYEKDLSSGGVSRHYILRVPKEAKSDKALPLVIVLHGWTASARLAEIYTGMGTAAKGRGYVVAFPDGLGSRPGWNAGFIDLSGQGKDDVAFVNSVIDEIESQNNIDPKRIYVCGHSNGAFLSHFVGAKIGHRLAAIGAVAGTIGLPRTGRQIPDPEVPLSAILIHGQQDQMVAYDSSSRAVMKGYGAVESAKWWAEKDGCRAQAEVNTTQNVVTTTYRGGKQGTEVVLVSLPNGTHNWPGGQTVSGPETTSGANAAMLLLDFFDHHVRRD